MLTPLATSGSSWRWACTPSPSAARIADDVGQVQLALVVLVGDPVESRPQPVAADDVVSRRSPRAARAAASSASRSSTIASTSPAAPAHDPPEVAADRLGAVDREQRRRPRPPRGAPPPVASSVLRLDQRVVGVHDQHVAVKAGQRARGRPGRRRRCPARCAGRRSTPSPGTARRSSRLIGRDDHHGRVGAQRLRAPPATSPAAGGRRRRAAAWAGATSCACPCRRRGRGRRAVAVICTQKGDWGAWIRTRGRGTKTRCLTTWPRPIAVRSGNHTSIGKRASQGSRVAQCSARAARSDGRGDPLQAPYVRRRSP